MEGISSVVASEECSPSGRDYGYFRKIMTLETNAAIEGAVAAGASEIVVRDSHGSKQNILPDLLDRRAKLLRGNSGTTENMMDMMDGTYDAVLFIGYHAKAGTPDAIIEHTSTSGSNSRAPCSPNFGAGRSTSAQPCSSRVITTRPISAIRSCTGRGTSRWGILCGFRLEVTCTTSGSRMISRGSSW